MGHVVNEINRLFPLSDSKGSPIDNINSELIIHLSKSSEPLSTDELDTIEKEHKLFIENGGANGSWQTFVTSGLIIGVYTGAKSTTGTQATLSNRKIEKLNLQNRYLPFTNGVGLVCNNQNFTGSTLNNCLFTDCIFESTNFEKVNLSYTDFSRSNLRNCSFKNADLTGVDFENCDCTGADFRGAKLLDSRFPGAILTNILF